MKGPFIPTIGGQSRMSRTLLAVVAHPDDDAWEVGGVVALHAHDAWFRFVLVHATDGAAGMIAAGSGATRDTLGAVRRAEDQQGWRTLGRVPDRHIWLDLPDGAVAESPYDTLVERLAAIMAEERPDVVLTFGPDGGTGHPDHIAVGRATDEAFLRCADDDRPGFHRLLHFAISPEVMDWWNAARTALGLPPFDPTQVYHPRPAQEPIGMIIDTSSVAARVEAGLLEHKTQAGDIHPPEWGEGDRLRLLSTATFVVAYPKDHTGVLTDLFAGL
jgi:LmbE family N-acetylglucosaminyl deacetylase